MSAEGANWQKGGEKDKKKTTREEHGSRDGGKTEAAVTVDLSLSDIWGELLPHLLNLRRQHRRVVVVMGRVECPGGEQSDLELRWMFGWVVWLGGHRRVEIEFRMI